MYVTINKNYIIELMKICLEDAIAAYNKDIYELYRVVHMIRVYAEDFEKKIHKERFNSQSDFGNVADRLHEIANIIEFFGEKGFTLLKEHKPFIHIEGTAFDFGTSGRKFYEMAMKMAAEEIITQYNMFGEEFEEFTYDA